MHFADEQQLTKMQNEKKIFIHIYSYYLNCAVLKTVRLHAKRGDHKEQKYKNAQSEVRLDSPNKTKHEQI